MKFEKQDLRSGIDPGSYCVRIREITQRPSRSGNPIVEVGLEILEGEHSGAWLRDYFVIGGSSPKAISIGKRRLARLCSLCGLAITTDAEIDLEEIIGRDLIAEVCEAPYQGRSVPRVRAYFEMGDAPF